MGRTDKRLLVVGAACFVGGLALYQVAQGPGAFIFFLWMVAYAIVAARLLIRLVLLISRKTGADRAVGAVMASTPVKVARHLPGAVAKTVRDQRAERDAAEARVYGPTRREVSEPVTMPLPVELPQGHPFSGEGPYAAVVLRTVDTATGEVLSEEPVVYADEEAVKRVRAEVIGLYGLVTVALREKPGLIPEAPVVSNIVPASAVRNPRRLDIATPSLAFTPPTKTGRQPRYPTTIEVSIPDDEQPDPERRVFASCDLSYLADGTLGKASMYVSTRRTSHTVRYKLSGDCLIVSSVSIAHGGGRAYEVYRS